MRISAQPWRRLLLLQRALPKHQLALADGSPGFKRRFRGPCGKDLFLRHDGSVAAAGGFPLNSRPVDFHFIDRAEFGCPLGLIGVSGSEVGLFKPAADKESKPQQVWSARAFVDSVAVAVARNAVVVAGTDRTFEKPTGPPSETFGITALNITDGTPLWKHPLPAGPVSWGLAIDRRGRMIVALQDGSVVCLVPAQQ